jgi:hypothetical protein
MPRTTHTALPPVFEIYDPYDVQYTDTHEIVHVYEIEKDLLDDNPGTPPEELVTRSRAPDACRFMPKKYLIVDRTLTVADFASRLQVHVDQVRNSCNFSVISRDLPNPRREEEPLYAERRRRDDGGKDDDDDAGGFDLTRYRTDENNEMHRVARDPETGLWYLTDQELDRRLQASTSRQLLQLYNEQDDADHEAQTLSVRDFEYERMLDACVFYETLIDYMPLVQQLGVSMCRAPLVILVVPGPDSPPTFRLMPPKYPAAPAGYQRDRERLLSMGDFEEKEVDADDNARNFEFSPAARRLQSIFEDSEFDHGEEYLDGQIQFPPLPPPLRRMGRFAGRDLDSDSDSDSEDDGPGGFGFGSPVHFPILDWSTSDSSDEAVEPVPPPWLGGMAARRWL